MKWPKHSSFCHAIIMVSRNIKSYILLAVTIVISFSLLLGYLVFLDTTLYNQYKEVLSQPRNIVITSTQRRDSTLSALAYAIPRVDPEATFYSYFSTNTILQQYGRVRATVYFMPSGEIPVYTPQTVSTGETGVLTNGATEIELIAGCSTFRLKGNEAIISENLFRALHIPYQFPVSLAIPVQWKDQTMGIVTVSIIGVCEDTQYTTPILYDTELQTYTGTGAIYTTQGALGLRSMDDFTSVDQYVWFCCKHPEAVASCIREFGLIPSAICIAQNDAIEDLRTQNTNKFYTVLLLLVVLGVNLYSAIHNALADRQFEIGVKLALGANSWNIVLQFAFESTIVMLASIYCAVILVTDILVAYKYIQEIMYGIQWTVHISSYSVAMFCVSSISLTVLFSLIFAYRASRVEIIQHLKAN